MHLLLVSLLLAASAESPLPARAVPQPANARLTALPASAPMAIGLNLVVPGRAELDALVVAQHTPGTPEFRRYLTPEEIGARFGQPLAQYEALAQHFETRGLKVTRWPTRMRLDVAGTVGQLDELLGIQELQVTVPGRSYRTFQGTPRLPSALAALVRSVGGLDSTLQLKPRIVGKDYSSGNPTTTFGPADLRAFYDLAALHAAGKKGQNQKVAMLGSIPGTSNAFKQADITTYYSTYSGATALLVVDTMPNPNQLFDTQNYLDVEETMDAELLTVGAPSATSVTMVLSPYDQLLDGAINYIVNSHPDFTAISISFGNCESALASYTDFAAVDGYLAAGNAEGQSWFAASGDNGAQDCGSGGAAVDFPASAPHMVAVGGTEYTGSFDANNAVTAWNSEQAWNETSWGGGAGGGGVSTVFARPAWQNGAGTSSVNARELPDLSALAAQQYGIGVVLTVNGTRTLYNVGSGTSAASPLTAGIFAAIASDLGCRIGLPSPVLYTLGDAQAQGGTAVFHDLVSGNLNYGGITGPSAHPGYDEATGWGSLDANAIAGAFTALGCSSFPVSGSGGTTGISTTGSSSSTGGTTGSSSTSGSTGGTSGTACDPNVVPSPCGTGNACYPNSSTSGGGTCGPGCTTTPQCGSGAVCDVCISGCVTAGNNSNTIGGPCTQDADCPDSAQCVTQAAYGWPGGYCLSRCSSSSSLCSCPSGALCADGAGFPACLATCSVSGQSGCRSGYSCWSVGQGDLGACMPPCTASSQCLVAGDACNNGFCAPPSGSSSSSGSTGATSGTSGTSGTSSGSTTSGSGTATSTSGTSSGGTTANPNTGFGATSSGSTSGSSSGTASKSGCGCGAADAGLEPLFGLLSGLALLARRRAR